VKKLRYAAEFFDELFPGKKVVKRQKKFTSALKQLQDGPGDLNDIAVDERLMASVAPIMMLSLPDCIQVRKE
jgi:CHAD domain-containing protein